jgi:arylsulfatase A-like enzyme
MYSKMKSKTTLAFLTIVSQFGLQAQNKAEPKPNIIFIFADDLGWGDLSCYGSNVATPNIDRLASKGTLFTNFYVAGSVSSPSRAGIMTGQYPARNRIFGHLATHEFNQAREMPDNLNPDITTLADILKVEGYCTGHFGKWHLGLISPSEYGFSEFRTDKDSNIENKGPIQIWSPASRPVCTRDILSETFNFIKRNQKKPFFVNAWLSDVHASLNPSADQLDKVNFNNMKDPSVPFYGVRQIYYAALVEMDRQIGLFLDSLKQIGLDQNTIVIFSSDNGPEDLHIINAAHSGAGSPGPFRGRKRSLYDGGIRTPFIVSWPNHIPEGVVNNNTIIGGVDFIPTLCSLTHSKLPQNMTLDGEDMSAAILGDTNVKRNNPLFWEWRYDIYGFKINVSPRLAMRTGNWKYLMNPDSSRKELYNIVNDPQEIDNLASENIKLVKSLSETLMNWYKTIPKSVADKTAGDNRYPWPTMEKIKRMNN